MAIKSVVGCWSFASSIRFRAVGFWPTTKDERPTTRSQFFYRHLVIRIDAHFTGNLHGFFANLPGRQLRVLGKGLGGGFGKWAATANGGNSAIRLNYIALAAQQEGLFLVGYQEQSFEMAQELIGTPVLRKFYRRTANIAVILLQLSLEATEKREGVSRGAGEACENLILVEAPDLLGIVLHHAGAERDLAIPGHDHMAIAADAQDCSGTNQALLRHEGK